MSAQFSSILDGCSSILERINSLWAVLGPSPPPYQDDLLRLEMTVLDLKIAVSYGGTIVVHGSAYLRDVEEAASVADDLLRDLGRKLPEPSTPYPKLASIKHKLFKEGASTEVDEEEEKVVDPVIKARNLYGERSSIKQKKSKEIGLVGASSEEPKILLFKRQEAVFSDWLRDIRERLDHPTRKAPSPRFRWHSLRLRHSCDVDSSPAVHGRDDDKKKVIELLLTDSCGVSVVWIVAAAGMGKTTLCHLVYSDPEVCNFFEIKLWVSCVSSDAKGKGMLRSILESLTGISCYLTEIDQLQEALEEELVDKRFLLVLDDVRHMDQSFWNDFLLPPLRAGAKGSIVVVTTRKTTVPNFMESIQPYYLGSLSDENCWTIFFSLLGRVFHKSDFEDDQHIILFSKCKGVPLFAKALGGLLRFTDLKKISFKN